MKLNREYLYNISDEVNIIINKTNFLIVNSLIDLKIIILIIDEIEFYKVFKFDRDRRIRII